MKVSGNDLFVNGNEKGRRGTIFAYPGGMSSIF